MEVTEKNINKRQHKIKKMNHLAAFKEKTEVKKTNKQETVE